MDNTVVTASMPLQYKRLYKGPLEADTTFTSLEDAQSYAQSPTAYPGQIISIYFQETDSWGAYIISSNGALIDCGGKGGSSSNWEVLEIT